MLKEVRNGLLVLLGTTLLGTVLIGSILLGLYAFQEHMERKQRIREGCLSDDGRDMQLCGGEGGFAR